MMPGLLATPADAAVAQAPSGTKAPQQALARLVGASRRQRLQAFALVAGISALACALRAYAWLGMFAMLLLPLLLCTLALQASQLRPAWRSWRALWLVLGAALLLSGALALLLYRWWMQAHALRGLNAAQVLACAIGFGALVLALPLRHAQNQAGALHLAELKRAALAARLQALQAQIEPHFLYNTLANTRYLARHEPAKAVVMLDHLIAYLHAALPDLRSPTSTLGREFELAEHYLALMAIRFGARLRYRLDCPAHLRGASVPPLMLMALVENAVQHGVEPQPGAVCVALVARADADKLTIVVGDDGAGLGQCVLGSGVGLRNVRERLAALFGERASVTLRAGTLAGTDAVLCLPLTLAPAPAPVAVAVPAAAAAAAAAAQA